MKTLTITTDVCRLHDISIRTKREDTTYVIVDTYVAREYPDGYTTITDDYSDEVGSGHSLTEAIDDLYSKIGFDCFTKAGAA